MQTVLYARVSTSEQTLATQRLQAEAAGYRFDQVVADEGVSGISTKMRDRPQGKRLFDILRKGDVLVVRWIDRLGRNYADVTDTVRELLRKGVTVTTIINRLTFDGSPSDPMQEAVRDALIAFMAASAQAQSEATKEAQRAGIEFAKGLPGGKAYRGRQPTFRGEDIYTVLEMAGNNTSISEIARMVGISRQAVYRIVNDPAAAQNAVVKWNFSS